MSNSVINVEHFKQEDLAAYVGNLWHKYNNQRSGWLSEQQELRDYLFATDTTTTTNADLPWKNKTTIPKLTQIRDNLHSNYLSSLFPHDDWLTWTAYSADAAQKDKAQAIQTYMTNKTREGGFRTTVSLLLNDYIDYGVAFTIPSFESRQKELANGELVPGFVGPKCERLSPMDIVFDPTARSFEDSYKVVRSMKSLGDIAKMARDKPEERHWQDILDKRKILADLLGGGFKAEDFNKATGYDVDGFGSLHEYYQSHYVEILEFYGDFFDVATGEYMSDRVVTVADRSIVVRNDLIPSWFEGSPIRMAGWRKRPDNLWPMGPLHNLVGLQYRLDHLENIKADAMDLMVNPPKKIFGNVEEFDWEPGAEIHIDEGGDVQEMGTNLGNINVAQSEMQQIMDKMELMAGAPREAMGQRTPGEKTALEVQTLSSAASRIFQEKITSFEIELLEPTLNLMLEVAARNMLTTDIIRVMDDDLGVTDFKSITKDDITANGKLRPVGARHFAKQAQDLQNMLGVANSPLWAQVQPHVSGLALTKWIDDTVGVKAYKIFQENIAITEQQESQRQQQAAGQGLQDESMVPSEEELMSMVGSDEAPEGEELPVE